MTPEQLVNDFISAIERGDIDGAIACMSEDCEYDNVPMSKAIGHEAIRSTLSMFVTPDKPPRFKVIRQVAAGDLVMNERIDSLEVFGKAIEVPVAGVWEVRGDRIVLWRDYFDLQGFNAQMA